jgi:hypothetical protein
MRAEIRAGELLAEMAERKERHDGSNKQNLRGSHAGTPVTPKLADLGVSKSQSSRWQRLARMSRAEQEKKIAAAKKKMRSTLDGTTKLERAELQKADEARVAALRSAPGKYRALIVDPPWDYEWLSLAGRAKPGYATMTHDELLALDVAAWAEDTRRPLPRCRRHGGRWRVFRGAGCSAWDGPARASWRVLRSPNRAYVLGFVFLHGRQQGGMCGRFQNPGLR